MRTLEITHGVVNIPEDPIEGKAVELGMDPEFDPSDVEAIPDDFEITEDDL